MAERSYRGLALAVVGCLVAGLVAGLVGCTTVATGSNAAGSPPPASTPDGGAPAAPVRVLQLNLCGSGIAACYTGRSTAEAAAVIRAQIPDLVTLNEVCQDDVSALQRALAEVVPGGAVVSAFQATRDRDTGDAYRCRNGRPYGIGVVSRWPSVPGSSAEAGIYPTQHTDDPEERAWLCLDVAARRPSPSAPRTWPTPSGRSRLPNAGTCSARSSPDWARRPGRRRGWWRGVI
jgi:hypothetical protein